MMFVWYALKPDTLFEIDTDGIARKSPYLIGAILGSINTFFPVLAVVGRIGSPRITGTHITERINETLELEDNVLIYGYQNFAGHTDWDRVILKIPLNYIRKADRTGNKITIQGKMSQMYYDDFLEGETRAEEIYEDKTWIFYDYFAPDVFEVIKEFGGVS